MKSLFSRHKGITTTRLGDSLRSNRNYWLFNYMQLQDYDDNKIAFNARPESNKINGINKTHFKCFAKFIFVLEDIIQIMDFRLVLEYHQLYQMPLHIDNKYEDVGAEVRKYAQERFLYIEICKSQN